MELKRSVLLPYSAQDMFDLIERAEHYPSFLPWCTSAQILERSEDWVAARLDFSYLKIRFGFKTRNPKRRPVWLQVRLVEGPFRHFHGEWALTPLGDSGCKVTFSLSFEIADGALDRLAAPAIQRVAGAMVEAFVRRAEATLPKFAPAQGAGQSVAQTAQHTPGVARPAPGHSAPALRENAMSPPPLADRIEALGSHPLASGLTGDQAQRLAEVMSLTHWRSGEVLAHEGEVDSLLYVVVDGTLSVVKHRGTVDETALATLGGGDFAHELGFLDGMPRFASLVAATDARTLLLSRDSLDSLVDAQPRLVYAVLCAIMRAVHRTQTRLSVQASELTNYVVKQHGRY